MTIDSISDVTIEQLEDLKNSTNPQNVTINGTPYGRESFTYTINQAIEIKQAIQEIIKSIPDSLKEDKKAAFAYVYVKLALTLKDNEYQKEIYYLSGYYLDRAEDCGVDFNVTSSKNLFGLLTNITLWHGKSLILEEVAKELGIEIKTIYGGACFFDRNQTYWAWTQVKFDGVWYNCDIYRDGKFIAEGAKLPHFLKSDKDYNAMVKPRYQKPDECPKSISDEEQEALIAPARKVILDELALKEQKRREEYARSREDGVTKEVEEKLKKYPPFLRKYVEERIRRKVKENHVKRYGAW